MLIGQATIDLKPQDYVIEPDITRGSDRFGEPYIFSDGCGRLSVHTAWSICDQHLPRIDPVRSAYQVRGFNGVKGMLLIDTQLVHNPPSKMLVVSVVERICVL